MSIVPVINSIYDKAGNAASTTQTNNTVQMQDQANPSMTSLGLTSNNSNYTDMAKAGEEVTLTMTANESVTPPTVVFYSNGQAVNNTSVTVTPNSGSHTDYTAKYTVSSSDQNGLVSFEVSDFKDDNDNIGNVATAVTNSSTVTIDTISPTFTDIVMQSNNSSYTNLAKSGETITIDITAIENINQPTIAIKSGGSDAIGPVTLTGSDKNYTASYSVNSSDTDGEVSFTLSNISDLVGNTSNDVTALTSGVAVTVDKVAPTLPTVELASNNTTNTLAKLGETITLTIEADEDITAPTVAFTSGGDL